MLRRYLTTNAVTTVGLYWGVWEMAKSLEATTQAAHSYVQSFGMGQSLIGPIIDHVVVLSAGIAKFL